MPNWALYDSKWDWKAWLDTHLDDLVAHHASNLIIDLRGNEGGQDIGDEILKHLALTTAPASELQRLVRYRTVPPDLLPFLDTWDPELQGLGAAPP